MQNCRRSRADLGIGSLNRPSRFQAPDGRQPPGMTERQAIEARAEDRLDANRNGHVKCVADGDAVKPRRGDAEDLKRIAVERQPLTDDARVAAKIALPESVADVCGRNAASWLVILWSYKSPENRLDTQNVKEIAADANAFCVVDFPTGCQIEAGIAPNSDFRKTFLAFANLFPQRKCELRILAREIVRNPSGGQRCGWSPTLGDF